MIRSFRLSAVLAALVAAGPVVASAAEYLHEAVDRFLEAARDLSAFLFSPAASESIELDRLTATVEHKPTPWRAFLAFVSRALTHDRYAGDGFTYAGCSST